VLGIGDTAHNSAVCLLKGDRIVVAIQEERLTRIKRDHIRAGKQCLAIPYCLDYAGIDAADLDLVVCCETFSPSGKTPEHDVALNPILRVVEHRVPILTIPHHLGHAVSAFATSGFREAMVLVVDGAGSGYAELGAEERRAIVDKLPPAKQLAYWCEHLSCYRIDERSIATLEKHMSDVSFLWDGRRHAGMLPFRSLGQMFSSAAQQIFGNYLEAGKVMGLAPYGRPTIPVADLVTTRAGRLRFHDTVLGRFRDRARWPEKQTEYQDLAASVQRALEHTLLDTIARLRRRYPLANLCYAGGVALNSVANERIVGESGFEDVYFMPAAEDSGPAIGAAYYGLWQLRGRNVGRRLRHDSVGRAYGRAQIDEAIAATPAVRTVRSRDLLSDVVDLLSEGKIVAWFEGGAELGPRALGQRSILCDPRRPDGKEVLNRRVKFREAFRPFAPAILREEVHRWFDFGDVSAESPYMLRVAPFREEKKPLVPAVVHVDGTGRVQTVTAKGNGRFYQLVRRFFERTGVPIILNTSFNIMGEPIVETPRDALWCLLYAGIDYLVLEDRLLAKTTGYRSVLDLVPRVSATRFSREYVVRDEAFLLGTAAPEALYAHTRSAWGETKRRLTPLQSAACARVDGRKTGRHILEELQGGELPELGEREMIEAIGALARSSTIMLRAVG
jgi:carbamoyltransferase